MIFHARPPLINLSAVSGTQNRANRRRRDIPADPDTEQNRPIANAALNIGSSVCVGTVADCVLALVNDVQRPPKSLLKGIGKA